MGQIANTIISLIIMMILWAIMASFLIVVLYLIGSFFGVWEFLRTFMMQVAH